MNLKEKIQSKFEGIKKEWSDYRNLVARVQELEEKLRKQEKTLQNFEFELNRFQQAQSPRRYS